MTLIDLYAINIIENGYSFAKVPTILKPYVKAKIIALVGADNAELIEKLLAS
ncbi:hypothetical protein Javan629_0008 [Streptococcus phage Javan629]|uniref:CD1375 family protein n=1 Tax=Streptococcus uberis TaxID=1349 RepID=UPI000622A03E|nr:hypothetical protein [Streptococcus uberis]KKF47127.1 hypothetical protein AF62_08110 [Streptococcus uberis C8329]QBX22010.1 hypothetical protein Javan629_0008 [Streptococcus phage Javan629]